VRRAPSRAGLFRHESRTVTTTQADILDVAREPGVLTDLQLRVLELRELHGASWNQIAYMTDKHQATVRGHYRAAVRRVHRELERRADQ
jgi:DNA-directed RNA polymerase specialized sigma24 family protein